MNTPAGHPQWGCYHHYSFIIQRGKIVSYGTNTVGAGKRLGYAPYTKSHSEYTALMRARGKLDSKRPFYCLNIRLDKTNQEKVSAPCPSCARLLRSHGCVAVVYTTSQGFQKITL